jgi:hypothetical protein
MLLPVPSLAMELTFFGKQPDLPADRPLRLEPGVEPGARVTFDTSDPAATVLRPARTDEQSSAEKPLYVFDWQRRRVGRFYPVTPAAEIERLEREHALTGDSPAGRGLQGLLMINFLYGGQKLRSCVQPGQRTPEQLTVYLTFTAGAMEPSGIVVLPEGAIAECIVTSENSQNPYPAVPVKFVAKGTIKLVNKNQPPPIPAQTKKERTRPR